MNKTLKFELQKGIEMKKKRNCDGTLMLAVIKNDECIIYNCP